MRKSLIIIVLSIALAAAALAWWMRPAKQGEAPAAGAGAPAVAVEARPVTVGPISREIQAVGTLRSDESVMVRPEIPGRVKAIGFDEGQKVSKGQMLVKLDDASLAADHQQALASLELAKANAQRAVSLANRGAGTERARDEAEANLRVSQAKVEQSRAQLEKTQIMAPFGGVVGLRAVSIGAYVQTGQDIVNLEALDPIKVDFRVPELFLPLVQPGLSVTIAADAYPGRTFAGTVYAIDPAVDVQGRAVLVRARIANADGALRPGQFVRLALKLDEKTDAITIPEETVVPRGDKLTVFKVVDGKAQPTPIKTGKRQKGMVEVTEGLAPGDVVVTAGQMKLRPGVPVNVAAPGS